MPARKPGPSVKDPEMYEALRDDGASKEKAARISNAAANTSREAVGAKGRKDLVRAEFRARGQSHTVLMILLQTTAGVLGGGTPGQSD